MDTKIIISPEAVAAALKRQVMSSKDLSRRMKTSEGYISKLLAQIDEGAGLTPNMTRKLARALKVEPIDIMAEAAKAAQS